MFAESRNDWINAQVVSVYSPISLEESIKTGRLYFDVKLLKKITAKTENQYDSLVAFHLL